MQRASLPLLDELAGLLVTERFGRPARGYAVVDSTNTVAAAWAAEGAPEGALVAADYQARGRGRLGRAWHASPGQNLTFSLVLRPVLPPERLGLLPLVAALGIAEAVEGIVAPAAVAIKWPNDLLVDQRKACGVLLEATTTGAAPTSVVLGVGLNVNQTDFADDHAARATSLALAAGRPLPRAAVLADVLLGLESAFAALARDAAAVVRRYEERLHGRGTRLTLHGSGGAPSVTGILEGVTPHGALRLRTGAGERAFYAGDVTTRPPSPASS